jgi:serine/threonine-protein kinase
MGSSTAATGATLGHYRLDHELGRGGMGVVYRATDLRLGRVVAIKLVQPSVADFIGLSLNELRARLRQEAQLGARINHPNVVTVYAYEEVGDDALVAMEYVEGPTLADLLARGHRWNPVEAASLVAQAAEGVAAAHRLGIVHRDLKPGNLILAPDGRCKVLDFGIAKLVATEGPSPRSRTLLGTVQYMAPEQVLGRPVGPAADVWALGAIAHELVTGSPLFSATSSLTSAMQITRGVRFETGPQWSAPAEGPVVFASVVGPLFPFLQHALQTDPRARPADADTVRGLLHAAATAGTAATPVPTPASVPPMPAPRRSRRTRRDVVVLLGALIVMLLATMAGALTMLRLGSGYAGTGGGGVGALATTPGAAMYGSSSGGQNATFDLGSGGFAPPAGPWADSSALVAPPLAAPAPTVGTTWEVLLLGDANGYRFEPADFQVTEGDEVRFRLVSGGPHNVAFDAAALPAGVKAALAANMPNQVGELSSTMLLAEGETYTISFAGVPAGTYEYYCTPHLAMGMKGRVTVLPNAPASPRDDDAGAAR